MSDGYFKDKRQRLPKYREVDLFQSQLNGRGCSFSTHFASSFLDKKTRSHRKENLANEREKERISKIASHALV